MSSLRQITANRGNSQLSTGPKTEAGKRISSRNSFKHGLAADEFCVNGENPDLYNEALHDMLHEYNAQTTGDKYLVEQILQSQILAQRARYNLYEAFAAHERGSRPDRPSYDESASLPSAAQPRTRYIENVALIVRYLTQHERSAVRANDMLHKNRRLLKQEPTPEPLPQPKTATAKSKAPNEIGFVPKTGNPLDSQLPKFTQPEPHPAPIA